ncbi:CheW protein [Gloeomargarita lithophora Alchichica-D10]|uniref:CheW protein n=1 Tax=Gloeomargarita lithophora Alchichica-D10 TaxID=1188229 RepID=A0A1J0ABL9_9CYAN|nr:chemotaxis protein CheW [Gloeomargarita lithophora]APB33323.1 CheW protein [Gloeomargarita lithophora Alchichica-D10]
MKILHFPIGSLQLGLPLTQVQKVIPQPTVFSSGQKPIGLAHFEDQEVVVLDLHQHLFGHPSPTPATHLIVVKTAAELYGLPCPGMPTLVDVPPEQMRQIPPTYRQADTLGLASHVARLADNTTTLFLLDSQRLNSLCVPSPGL